MQGHKLDSMITVGPFQLSLFDGSVFLLIQLGSLFSAVTICSFSLQVLSPLSLGPFNLPPHIIYCKPQLNQQCQEEEDMDFDKCSECLRITMNLVGMCMFMKRNCVCWDNLACKIATII